MSLFSSTTFGMQGFSTLPTASNTRGGASGLPLQQQPAGFPTQNAFQQQPTGLPTQNVFQQQPSAGTMTGFGSSSIFDKFQAAYANSLYGRNSLGTSSSLASLALNTVVPGSNPIAPLRGIAAVSGLGQFVQGLQASAAQRKADEAANNSLQGIMGMLTTLLGDGDDLGDLNLEDLNLEDLAGGDAGGLEALLGGLTASADRGSTTPKSKAKDTSAAFDTDSMMAQLQSMMQMLQSFIGGGSPQGTGFGTPSNFAQQPGRQLNGQQFAQMPQQNPNMMPQPNNLFSQQLNFGVIDSAINTTLGSIAATLPLVNI